MADNYVILDQEPKVNVTPGRAGFQDVWQITYRVTDGPSKGTVAYVTVPEEEHTAAYVKAAIEAKIAQLDAVASL